MKHSIGIDFGTAKTMVSYFNPTTRQPQLVVMDPTRDRTSIPTTIHIDESGECLFGVDADEQIQYDPEGYCRAFKLHLGETEPVLPRAGETAESLASRFLRHVKTECEQTVFNGEPIDTATITIPINFSPARQYSLKRAAEAAGFTSVSFMPEPEAAGKAFLRDNPTDKFSRALVLDWGGGTLDIAIISRDEEGRIRADHHCAEGSDEMGGEEMDRELLTVVEEYWRATFGVPLIETEEKEPGLLRKAEEVKRGLSSKETWTFRRNIRKIDVSRGQFTQLIAEMLNSAVELVRSALAKNKNQGNLAPDAILLIGGTCQIPAVREAMETNFPQLRVLSWHHSHEAVALGATEGETCDAIKESRSQPQSVPAQKKREIPQNTQNNSHAISPEEVVAVITRLDKYDDFQEASSNEVHILEKAAQEGNMRAMSLLGSIYHHGCKVIKANPQKAFEYWLEAANVDSDAMAGLAMLYWRKNNQLALRWAQKAADSNPSLRNLAFLAILYFDSEPPEWKKIWDVGNSVLYRVGKKTPSEFSKDETDAIGRVCFCLACYAANDDDEITYVAMLTKGANFGNKDCKRGLQEWSQKQRDYPEQNHLEVACHTNHMSPIAETESVEKALWKRLCEISSAYLEEHPTIEKVYLSPVLLAGAVQRAQKSGAGHFTLRLYAKEADRYKTIVLYEDEIDLSRYSAETILAMAMKDDGVLASRKPMLPEKVQEKVQNSAKDVPPLELSVRGGLMGGYVLRVRNQSRNRISLHVESKHWPHKDISANITVEGMSDMELGWAEVDAARNFQAWEKGTVSSMEYAWAMEFMISGSGGLHVSYALRK